MFESKANSDYDKFLESDAPKAKVNKKAKKSRFSFLNSFSDSLRNPVILKKIGITLGVILLYRLLSSIPLTGVNMDVYRQFFGTSTPSESNFLLTIFTGGSLDTPSIVGLGLIAYINASIIIQILTPVLPKLQELSKEGARGTQLINQYTRYFTLILSLFYGVLYTLLLSRRDLTSANGIPSEDGSGAFLIDTAPGSDWPSVTKVIFIALVLAAGTMLLMWLAEMVTENGLGNGSSIIISVGILSAMPAFIQSDFAGLNLKDITNKILEGTFDAITDPSIVALAMIIIGSLLVIYWIVFVNESSRNIPIQYATRVRDGVGSQVSSLPIKLTLTGVLPIIFASSLLTIPQFIVPYGLQWSEPGTGIYNFMTSLQNSFLFAASDQFVDMNDIYYGILFFILIVLFGIFYSFIVMRPDETAERLQKDGAFIPGIRPGASTQKYITNVLLRIGFSGAIFLGLIALIPIISRNLLLEYTGQNLTLLSGIGGTSILIIVSVSLETVRQFNALRVSRSYERYV